MSKHTELPKVIKCGTFDISVVLSTNLVHRNTPCHGLWLGDTQTIYLDSALKGHRLLVILLHELNHALYWFFELDDSSPEERVVACMATGWATLYRDNPLLLKWLQRNSQ